MSKFRQPGDGYLLLAVLPHSSMVRGAREWVSLRSSRPQAAKRGSTFQASRDAGSAPPKPEIGFHVKADIVPYRNRRTNLRLDPMGELPSVNADLLNHGSGNG
jgi:hypothetical protein